jgi:hypothetical protein
MTYFDSHLPEAQIAKTCTAKRQSFIAGVIEDDCLINVTKSSYIYHASFAISLGVGVTSPRISSES